jgi:hypothetical protein
MHEDYDLAGLKSDTNNFEHELPPVWGYPMVMPAADP